MNDMHSTGNDIVALGATDKERTSRFRFYSKILSAGEQALYDLTPPDGLPFDRYVWLLWSVKESVYKFRKRAHPGLVFAPTKINMVRLEPPGVDGIDPAGNFGNDPRGGDDSIAADTLPDLLWERAADAGEGCYKGKVVCGSDDFYSRSVIRDGIIATVINRDENFENTWWGVRSFGKSGPAHQSSVVRSFVVDRLSSVLSRTGLRIEKDPDGCPVLWEGDRLLDIPVSLAHHDRFVAYSFSLSPEYRPASVWKKLPGLSGIPEQFLI
jgi:hypothetical protein